MTREVIEPKPLVCAVQPRILAKTKSRYCRDHGEHVGTSVMASPVHQETRPELVSIFHMLPLGTGTARNVPVA